MKEIKITSKNDTFQILESLKTNRTKRLKHTMFIVEGVQSINNAISNNWNIKHFLYQDKAMLSKWGKGIISNSTVCNYLLSNELMVELSEKDKTSELIAVVEMRDKTHKLSQNPLILIIDNPSKKGNLGAILRSADALFVDRIIVTGHSIDIYDPQVIVASMGSFFNVDIIRLEENTQVVSYINKLKKQYTDMQIIATALDSKKDICEADFTKPTIILLGNEANGLNNFYQSLADISVKINMNKNVDSLNVACATSIMLYEVDRQRRKKLDK